MNIGSRYTVSALFNLADSYPIKWLKPYLRKLQSLEDGIRFLTQIDSLPSEHEMQQRL